MKSATVAAALLLLGGGGATGSSAGAKAAVCANPFFPFCIETHDAKKRTLAEQAALAKELGFDGVGHLGLKDVAERLRTLDEAGLKLFWIHTTIDLDPAKPPNDPALMDVIPLLSGRGTLLSVNIVGRPPSDESADARAVEIVRAIADAAAKHGVRIVLYHHVNQWLERFEDAVRVAKKVERENVGVMFNLTHWVRKANEDSLRALLESGMAQLFCVAINGTDRPAEVQAGTGKPLVPLDEGDFDVADLMTMLDQMGFRGPVGLICWNIQGDARDHLTRSMAAWRKMHPAAPAAGERR